MNDLPFTNLKFISAILFSILIFQVSIASAGTIAPNLQAILDTSGFTEGIPVIITFKDRIDLKQYTDKDRKSRRTRIIRALREQALLQGTRMRNFTRARGIQNVQSLWLINGMALTVPPDAIQDLVNNPEVDEIWLDKVFPLSTILAPRTVPQAGWNLEAIDAPALWALGYRGQGVVIGSLDTGVDINHPDLRDRWRGGVNSWVDLFPAPGSVSSFPYDKDGHGTQTVGLMVGGQASGTPIGVAPDAKWIAAKIFNNHKFTTSSVLHQAFAWMADPDGNPATDDAPDIVNNSWGFVGEVNQCTPDFQTDIETLKALGIAVVFAAGNEAKIPPAPSSIAPANDPSSFAVGAVGDFPYFAASFSSRGPSACDGGIYPELVAPGVLVKTTDLSFGGISPDPYTFVSGTSFAAAHVSGVMALLLSAYPNLPITDPDPNDMEIVMNVEDALRDPASVLDLGPIGPDDNYGHGLVNAKDAFSLIDLDLDPCVISVDFAVQPDTSTPGVSIGFTSAVTGGTLPLVYTWDLDGDKQPDCDTADCAFTYQTFFSGITELTVTDALGCKAYAAQIVNIGINIQGVVKNLDEEVIPSAALSLVEQPSFITTSSSTGDFVLAGAPANQRLHVLVQGPLQMADPFIDTYSPFFITPDTNFGQDALLLRSSDIEPVLQTYDSLNRSQGMIIGRAYDENKEGIPGISIIISDSNGISIPVRIGYTSDNGDWDPSLVETSQNGTFVVFNVPDVPRDIILTTNRSDLILDNLEARVYPFVESPEKVTVAPLIERQSIPSTGGSGGGGGCFITEVTKAPVSRLWFPF